jgi:hypothetical protein
MVVEDVAVAGLDLFDDGVEKPAWWQTMSDEAFAIPHLHAVLPGRRKEQAIAWLNSKGREETTLTFGAIWARAEGIAGALGGAWGLRPGDRAMACYAPGPERVRPRPSTSARRRRDARALGSSSPSGAACGPACCACPSTRPTRRRCKRPSTRWTSSGRRAAR